MNNNFDANAPNGTPLRCIVCDKEIPDGHWFARIKLGDQRVALCRPWCAEVFAGHRADYAQKAGISVPSIEFSSSSSPLVAP